MVFRDDKDALLARNHALEQEVAELRAELDARDPPAEQTDDRDAAATADTALAEPASEIRAMVEARDTRARRAAEREQAIARRTERALEARPDRVRLDRTGPLMFGRVSELKVQIDDPDPRRLGEIRFESDTHAMEVDELTARDLTAFDAALKALRRPG